MKRKDIDYRCLILDRYYWLQEHQMEYDGYFKSYMRLNRELRKLEEESISRERWEYEDIFG